MNIYGYAYLNWSDVNLCRFDQYLEIDLHATTVYFVWGRTHIADLFVIRTLGLLGYF